LYKHKSRKRESALDDIGEPLYFSADPDQDHDPEPQEIDF